jgi:thiol-disulfide isomerase/thioredoxin
LVGALALEDLFHVDQARFEELYNLVSAKNQEFYLVQSAYQALQLQQRTGEGQPFTDYLVPGGNPDGSDVRLSDYVGRGKFILLDHWASWCGPCKAEIPYIKKTWEAFHGDRFEVVSIAVSDKRVDTERALQLLDMPWPQILDGQKIPKELYGVNAIPHLILFAPDGTILKRGLRGDDIYNTVAQVLK